MQRLWRRDEVLEALRESTEIVDELAPDERDRAALLGYAVQLVTQRAMQAPAPVLFERPAGH